MRGGERRGFRIDNNGRATATEPSRLREIVLRIQRVRYVKA